MACVRCVIIITVATAILAVSVGVQGGAAEPDGLVNQLPASREQVYRLAQEVCFNLIGFEGKDLEEKIKSCAEKFTNFSSDVSSLPSNLQITRESKNEAAFSTLAPKDHQQLVIFVPSDDEGFINFRIVNSNERSGTIPTDPSCVYSAWIAALKQDGSHSKWLRGPDVPRIPKHETEIGEPGLGNRKDNSEENLKINKPSFRYNNASNDVEATFVLDFIGKIYSGSDVGITNSCNKNESKLFERQLKPSESLSVVVDGLPLEDNCTFTVHEGKDEHQLSYRTPQCEELDVCKELPEVPSNISIEASGASSGVGWDVRVSWSPPARAPDRYNVTLRADKVHSLNVSGSATETTFSDIIGEGLYNVSIEAISANWKALTSRRALFPGVVTSSVSGLTVAAWCVALLAGALLAGTSVVWWRRRRHYIRGHVDFADLEDQFSKYWGSDTGPESGVDDSWEVHSEKLQLHEVIGEGAFGVVRRGTLAPAGKEVAVKMLKDFPTLDEIRSFRVEMDLMKSVGVHPHIVSLVGCCTGRRPLIVAEYCNRGDLLSYLRCSWDVMVSRRNAKYYNNNFIFKSKPQREHSKLVVNKLYDLQGICDAELTSLDLLSFCRQIAMGMEFLALNKVVHRDLAARNVLVSGDRTLKIADFGLSRDVYQENQYKQKGNGKMPVKWMALESLTHRIYTTQSDVWSFGVVVWEVVTVGAAPYPEVPAARLPRLLRAGYRMPRPNNCSKQLYELMLSCWRARPRDRPTFAELHVRLDELLDGACPEEYLSLELDDDDAPAPPTPKSQRYVKMILRGNRMWTRRENYERPLKAPPQSNHYSSPPAPLTKPQIA